MELLQKCSLFEEEEVAFNTRRHLEKINLIYDKSQELKKQQTTIDYFFPCSNLHVKIIKISITFLEKFAFNESLIIGN